MGSRPRRRRPSICRQGTRSGGRGQAQAPALLLCLCEARICLRSPQLPSGSPITCVNLCVPCKFSVSHEQATPIPACT